MIFKILVLSIKSSTLIAISFMIASKLSKSCLKTIIKRPPPSQPIPFKDLAKSAVLSYLAYRDYTNVTNVVKHKKNNDIPVEWVNTIQNTSEVPTFYDGKLNDIFKEDSQAYLWFFKEIKTIYLVFRGSTTFEDLKANIDIRYTNVKLKDNKTVFKLHSGFYNQTYSILPQIINDIHRIDGEYDTIVCTGHSLGSAMAIIAATLLYHEFPDKTIKTHTFGAPRAGDLQFSQWFNTHITDNWRVFNENDPVPCLPPSLRFHHVHNGLCIDDDVNLYEAKYDDPIFMRILRLFIQIDVKNLIGDHDNQCYVKRILQCCDNSK